MLCNGACSVTLQWNVLCCCVMDRVVWLCIGACCLLLCNRACCGLLCNGAGIITV